MSLNATTTSSFLEVLDNLLQSFKPILEKSESAAQGLHHGPLAILQIHVGDCFK